MSSDTESPIEEVSIWAFFIKIDIKMIWFSQSDCDMKLFFEVDMTQIY